MLNTKDTWVGTIEAKNTNVKHVGRNSQRSSISYGIGNCMTQKEMQNVFHVKHVGKAFSLGANFWSICGPTGEKPATSVISVGRHCQVGCLSKHTDVFTQVRNPLCVTFVARHSTHQIIWVFTNALTQVQNRIPAKSVARDLHSVQHFQFTCVTTQGSDHTSVNYVTRHLLPRHCWTHTSRTMTECSVMFLSLLLLQSQSAWVYSCRVFLTGK